MSVPAPIPQLVLHDPVGRCKASTLFFLFLTTNKLIKPTNTSCGVAQNSVLEPQMDVNMEISTKQR